jgi:hypothetical protein
MRGIALNYREKSPASGCIEQMGIAQSYRVEERLNRAKTTSQLEPVATGTLTAPPKLKMGASEKVFVCLDYEWNCHNGIDETGE